VHEGLVATQSLAGGDEARRAETVVLQPSLGITMPDLIRRPAGSATGRLGQLGIRFRQDGAASVTIPKGDVVQTRPAKGTLLKADQVVTVVVSTGKPLVKVPDVAGRRLRVAEARLADAHLRAKAEQVFDDDVPKGRVVGTDPRAGAMATWGSTVTVRVSKGPDLVVVPGVVGLTKEEAEQRLAEAGLRWSYVLPVGSRVVDQSPEPGQQAKRGSEVRLLLNLL
jgi:eukaryotic-like serine/threonine-protein kinase